MSDEFDAFDTALRSGLCDAAQEWTPSAHPVAIGERIVRRIHQRRRRQAATLAGFAAAGLAAILLVGQVVAEPQVLNQVASGTTTSMIGQPGTDGGTASTATGPKAACETDCPTVTTGSQPGAVTTASTTSPVGGQQGHGFHPTTLPSTEVSLPVSVPTTSQPVVTVPATTVPPSTTEPPPTTVTSLPPPTVYVVTAADMGKTINVNAGDDIEVDLSPCPGGSWGAVSVSNSAVLVRQAPPASVPPPGTAIADFQAASSGQSKITARQHSTCAATPSAAFTVTIVVAGSGGPGNGGGGCGVKRKRKHHPKGSGKGGPCPVGGGGGGGISWALVSWQLAPLPQQPARLP